MSRAAFTARLERIERALAPVLAKDDAGAVVREFESLGLSAEAWSGTDGTCGVTVLVPSEPAGEWGRALAKLDELPGLGLGHVLVVLVAHHAMHESNAPGNDFGTDDSLDHEAEPVPPQDRTSFAESSVNST